MFALYGPVLNYHSVDVCLCKKCGPIGKEYLKNVINEKMEEEKMKMVKLLYTNLSIKKGILSASTSKLAKFTAGKTLSSTSSLNSKIHVTELRLIDEKVLFFSNLIIAKILGDYQIMAPNL